MTFINSKRQGPNLKYLLTNARFTTPDQNLFKVKACGQPRCKCCNEIKTGFTFYFKTQKKHSISNIILIVIQKNVIYILSCNKYHEYNIGKTEQKLRYRQTLHRSGVNNPNSGKVYLSINIFRTV